MEHIQIIGNKTNPYHLSVGMIVQKENKIVVLKKPDGSYKIPSETMYIDESIEQCINRGMQEELGMAGEIKRYVGSLVNSFYREDGTEVEKTTIYFLATYIREVKRKPEFDEFDDEILFFNLDEVIKILEEQGNERGIIKKLHHEWEDCLASPAVH
jgi:NADH pyrophosphatase NudC (nudix superfamily)